MIQHRLIFYINYIQSDFKQINVANYGNCFMFNSKYNRRQDLNAGERVSSLTGPSFGLKMALFMDEDNYMTGGYTPQVLYLSQKKYILY